MRPAIRGASSAISSIPRRQVPLTFRSRPTYHQTLPTPSSIQALSSTAVRFEESSAEKSARKLNEKSLAEHEDGYKGSLDNVIGQQKEMQQKEMQQRTPWHREGSDMPPVKRMRSASAMTKGMLQVVYYQFLRQMLIHGTGKLLTTPSRLLKLILPLTTLDKNSDRKDIEPLALLVHPHQPLSYLERLIQSELPMIESSDGKHKSPQVHFRAEQSSADEIEADKKAADLEDEDGEVVKDEEGSEAQMIDGKLVKLGKINEKKAEAEGGGKIQSKKARLEESLRGGPGEGGVESYSGAGREGSSNGEKHFVRWSSSTEIGDFIRDAARGSEFAVEIEGAENEIRVGVPSFNDRTHYLRVRLRKTSKKLANYASIKKECDRLAHKSAQRLAIGGFGVLMGWWCAIYYFTFMTDYGWDLMEPVTVSFPNIILPKFPDLNADWNSI